MTDVTPRQRVRHQHVPRPACGVRRVRLLPPAGYTAEQAARAPVDWSRIEAALLPILKRMAAEQAENDAE